MVIPSPAKAHQQIRLTTLRDGKPENGIKVSIFKYDLGNGEETAPRFVLTSDRYGQVFTPLLAPGHYHLLATSEKRLRADLYLDVSAREHANKFSMDLVPDPVPTREDLIAKAEDSVGAEQVKEFRGVVYDPAGAVIPRVSIEIVRRGTQGKDHVGQVKSGDDGEFTSTLPNGSYLAIFSSPGFQIRYVGFDMTGEGTSGLRITLKIGADC